MKKILIVPFVLLLLTMFACDASATLSGLIETGTIRFVSDNKKYHNDTEDIPQVPVSIYSDFATQKVATITIQDVYYECVLEPKTTSVCADIPLSEPGVYEITASVQKIDGGEVTAKTSIEWVPYSYLDKMAQKLAGGPSKDPALGYLFGIAILVVFGVVLLSGLGAWFTKGSVQGLGIGAVAGFFVSMVLLAIAVYQFASPGLSALVIASIVAVIIVAILALVVINGINRGTAVARVNRETFELDDNGQPKRTVERAFFAGPGQYSPSLSAPTSNPNLQIFGTKEEIYAQLMAEKAKNQYLPPPAQSGFVDIYDQQGRLIGRQRV